MHAAIFFSVPKLLVLFHLSKVHNYKKKPEFYDDWCPIIAAKWETGDSVDYVQPYRKTFSDFWFVDNQSSIINLFCRKLLCFLVNEET